MKKTDISKNTKVVFDLDNPEWTSDRIKRAVPLSGLPANVQRVIRGVQAHRGAQKAPKKVPVSIRLSPDVVEGLRATGAGWQVRADEVLRSWLGDHSKATQ
jgi:uncharacterized protein (DUF4415 family)